MPHKPPDNSINVRKALLALWFFASVSTFASAQQQHASHSPQLSAQHQRGKSTWVEAENAAAPIVDAQQDNLRDARNQLKKPKSNPAASKPKDTRADLIPFAPDERAIRDGVRAPARPAQAQSPGHSSLREVRSLQDWKIEDIVLLATVNGSIHAADRGTGQALWAWPADRPMVETQYHRPNRSEEDSVKEPWLTDFIWIVEPSEDGELYGFMSGSPSGMRKLGLTVKKLVNELSPYQSFDPPVVYNGEKRSTLYTIDVATGVVLKYFSAGGSLVNDQSGMCRQKSDLNSVDDDKCGPLGALTITRTEYTVSIHSHNGDAVCTIKYSEWGPNIRDKDLQHQYQESKDHRYIHSKSDGEIYAFMHNNQDDISNLEPAYHQKYTSPVVRVFDIARPLQSAMYETPLILLPQPRDPVFSVAENQKVLVGCTDSGSLYALSETMYPLATMDQDIAECVRRGWGGGGVELTLKDFLTGVHPLGATDPTVYQVPGLDAPPDTPTLDPPGNNNTPQEVEGVIIPPTIDVPGSRYASFDSSQIFLAVFVLFITAVGGVGAGRLLSPAAVFGGKSPLPPVLKVDAPVVDIPQPALTESETTIAKEIEKSVKFAEGVDKEDEPSKVADQSEVDKETLAKDEVVDEQVVKDVAGKKRKAHRGKRGGKKAIDKQTLKESMQQEHIDGIVEGVKQINQNMSVTPDIVYQTENGEKDAPAGLLNLEIHTDNILGHGSGGTLVFEGKFEGRDVAVKRMLGQYSELASQEVALLEQSEEHPNVIRYYCRRQDEHFLYIALELCQASLWEIYRDGRRDEVPEKYNDLLQQINTEPNRVLRQLAEGLKHLHTFRIVHRDIKPQNMLIAYPKKHTTSTFPRVVISDFGLCKTLPEGASTLIGATVSAGTIGWKAPELISQPKDASGVSASNQSTGNGSMNGELAAALGIKRSTDIFSLGCVFFYVLSGGQHPFDDEEGWMGIRERNIKANKINLEAISIHGPDTVDLIQWMLEAKPEDRPTAAEVLAHPFFWNAEDRLEFLSLTSDRFDMEARDGTSPALAELESYAEEVIGAGPTTFNLSSASATSRFNSTSANHQRSWSSHSDSGAASTYNIPIPGEPNFLAALDKKFIDTLGKQRKYQGYKVVDLLRALRNKHHHWDDMPDDVKQRVGAVPEGYLRYWEQRFPKLTVSMWRVVKDLGMCNERRYWRWFGGRVD